MTQPPAPRSDDEIQPGLDGRRAVADGRGALARIIVALAVATSLSTDRLVQAAEQQPYGTVRSILIGISGAAHSRAGELGLVSAADAVAQVSGIGGGDELAATPLPLRLERPRTSAVQPATVESPPTTAGPPRPDKSPLTTAGPPRPGTSTATTTTQPGPLGLPAPEPPLEEGPAPSDAVQPTRSVNATNKLRVWAGGDSLGEYVGNQLRSTVGDPDLVDVQLSFHISTGLARPDYFDWPAALETVMTADPPPEALVFMVGGNDDQGMRQDSDNLRLGTDAWYEEYRRRVGHLMDTAQEEGSHLYWIGLPPMREARRHDVAVGINQVLDDEAAERSWVTFMDIAPLFTSADGDYAAQLTDPLGARRVVRAPDGVHITYAGSEWVTEAVWTSISERWQLAPSMAEPPRPVPRYPPPSGP